MAFVQYLPFYASRSMEPGLSAAIADPLWLLCRQWQVGELSGEDAASPAMVSYKLEKVPVDTLTVAGVGKSLSDTPLEVQVEAENIWSSAAVSTLSREIGELLVDALEEIGASTTVLALQALVPPPPAADPELSLLDRRCLDGRRLYEALVAANSSDPVVSRIRLKIGTLPTTVRAVIETWMNTIGTLLESTESGAWRSEQQEYRFQVSTRTPDGELVLQAGAYSGQRLDWDAFEVVSGSALRGDRPAPTVERTEALVAPGPVRYRGMPASRWWEYEDGSVNFGNLSAEPEDVVRTLLTEFATCFGDDWFLLPVSLPVGVVCRISSLNVVDSFGRSIGVDAMAARDARLSAARPWRFLELSGDPGPASGKCPWLYLAPRLADRQEGETLEEVLFLRDEASNLGWAVEVRREGADGRAHPPPAAAPPPDPPSGWSYTLAAPVPPGWVPLLPVRVSTGEIELQRGRLAGWTASEGPVAKVLEPGKSLSLREEVVPAAGMRVRRSWQRCRGSNGRVYLWVGREKLAGRGETTNGWVGEVLTMG